MCAAIYNSGLTYPRGRLTVNLAPADLRKEGPAYDLPIAVAVRSWPSRCRPIWLAALFLGASRRWMALCATSRVSCPWRMQPEN